MARTALSRVLWVVTAFSVLCVALLNANDTWRILFSVVVYLASVLAGVVASLYGRRAPFAMGFVTALVMLHVKETMIQLDFWLYERLDTLAFFGGDKYWPLTVGDIIQDVVFLLVACAFGLFAKRIAARADAEVN